MEDQTNYKESLKQKWYKFLDDNFTSISENVFVLSTFMATTLTVIKYCYPSHYNDAVEVTTTWLFLKKGH